jgi:hypothetical protein
VKTNRQVKANGKKMNDLNCNPNGWEDNTHDLGHNKQIDAPTDAPHDRKEKGYKETENQAIGDTLHDVSCSIDPEVVKVLPAIANKDCNAPVHSLKRPQDVHSSSIKAIVGPNMPCPQAQAE